MMKNEKNLRQLSFQEYVNYWLNIKKQELKISSLSIYQKMILLHLIPYFSHLKMKNIRHEDIACFVDLLNQKVKNGIISYRYGESILTLLKSILFSAKIDIHVPKLINNKTPREIKLFTLQETRILIKACLQNLNLKKLGILLTLFTGIRLGELCALTWKDIDLKNKTISIHKTLQRIQENNHSYLLIDIPKTKHSIRIIPICDFLYPLLKKYYVLDDIYLLSNKKTPLEPRNYRRFYDELITSLPIHKINFHGLRHTFASISIEAGVDFKTVSELLGHSSISITLNTYVHLSMNYKRKGLEKMAKFIS